MTTHNLVYINSWGEGPQGVFCATCGWHTTALRTDLDQQAANHQKEETMKQTQENMKVINRVRFIDIGGHMINVSHISHIEPYENWNPEKPGTTLGDPGTRIWMNNGRDLTFHDLTIDRFCDIMTSQLASAE